ncbi:hypothetical protein JCM5350_002810 [Sporobolomyces pararoseus]
MIFSHSVVALVAALGFVSAAPVWNPVMTTSKGQISGLDSDIARRFTMPYAQAPVGSLRFSRPQPLSHFNGTGIYDGTKLPPACLQNDSATGGHREQSEDCLYMNIFTPKNIAFDTKLPVFVWVHGGSFVEGGIADIDGSNLAASQNMIVVTVQYRLGVFGWSRGPGATGMEGNYGLRDLIAALETVKQDISAFGGDASRVTLAGQSSGAQMVNALLSAPSASSLFQRAIVQSAPLDYKPQSPQLAEKITTKLMQEYLGNRPTRNLLRGVKSDAEILGAQRAITGDAAVNNLFGAPQAEAFNIVLDDQLISGDTNSIANSGKQVIYTTVKDEACVAVFGGEQLAQVVFDIQPNDFEGLVGYSFPSRAQSILDSKLYQPASDAEVSDELIELTTDFAWTCATQRNALASAGGSSVYLGEFDLGVQTLFNSNVPFCQGKVAHEDDIAVVFNTPSSGLSSAQTALIKEVQARWGAFARTGNPNPSGYSNWPALPSSGGIHLLQLGNNSNGGSSLATAQRTDACKLYSSI